MYRFAYVHHVRLNGTLNIAPFFMSRTGLLPQGYSRYPHAAHMVNLVAFPLSLNNNIYDRNIIIIILYYYYYYIDIVLSTYPVRPLSCACIQSPGYYCTTVLAY